MAKLSRADFEMALLYSHLPTLAVCVAQASGDDSLISGPVPVYDFFGDGMGDFPAEFQERIRAEADRILWPIISGEAKIAAPPGPERIRRMINWIAGGEVPESYLPLLNDELLLDGVDRRVPEHVPGKVSAIVIGAGMSGLLAAYRLQQAGVSVTILEANSDVGGTWFLNRYPGVRVDTPNHLYSYSFEPNHEWPDFYSQGDVLLQYFQRFATKYGLRDLIRFETRVEEAAWDAESGKWKIRANQGAVSLEADMLVSAVGQLNEPRYPDIPGREKFAGPAFHSARWDASVDLAGKRVAVIGTGASAFQFVPEIALVVQHMDVFQRTPPWLGPTDNYHEAVPEAFQWGIQHFPNYDKWYRFWLFWMLTDGVLPHVRADEGWNGPAGTIGAANAEMRAALVEKIAAQVQDNPALLSHVVPNYPFGGKRSLRDNGVWLKALQRENVDLITSPIREISADAVITADGKRHLADVLIYGTGFHASDFLRSFKVKGEGGQELHEKWNGDARAYLGMTVPGFPNFFMIYGPNTNIVVNGSIIFFSECAVNYIAGAARLIAESGPISVKQSVHDAFNARVDAENAKMAWGHAGVTSWYKNATGRVSQNWPFALVDYWKATRKPNPDDFEKSGSRRAAA